MASEAQIAANRRNALRSTGPRTAEGKAVASENALRHGMRAERVVLFDEQAEEFEALHAELTAELAPEDPVERELVERIIHCAWRLRRAARAEAAMINESVARVRTPGYKASVAHPFCRSTFELGALGRYETAVERAFHRAMGQLERRRDRRAARAGNPMPGDGVQE